MDEPSQHEKGLYRIMVAGTCISFGLLGAIAASMKDFFHGNAAFQFSVWTLVGFIIGFAIGWLFWRIVRAKLPR